MAKVLLISPSTHLREVLAEHLHQCGFLVIRAEKASHGLNLLRAHQPELVIVDHKLPDLDGLSLCVLIRQDVSFNRSEIVMLADAEYEADMARALDAGADDYILRGASLHLMASRLRAVMRRAGDQRPGAPHHGRIFDNGRLRVDLVGRSVDVGQRELRLSYQEFELLAEFIRHPGIPSRVNS